MKKLVLWFFVAVMTLSLFALVACDKNDPDQKDPEVNNPPAKYTVTYDANGGEFANNESTTQQTVDSGSKLIAPSSPSRANYNFAGWTKSKNGSDMWLFDSDTVNGNITLYAKWGQESAIILSVEGASIDEQEIFMFVEHQIDSVSLAQKVVCSEDSVWKLYRDADGQTEIPTRMASGLVGGNNEYYVVVSSQNGVQVNTYHLVIHRSHEVTITYRDGESVLHTDSAYTGYEYEVDYTPNIIGYTFNFWKSNATRYTTDVLWDSLTLTADKTAKEYDVTFDVNKGNELDQSNQSKAVTYDSTFRLPVPTRTGYSFTGWYLDNNTQITDSKGDGLVEWNVDRDVELTAHWQANEYELIVVGENSSAGSVTGGGTYAYDSTVYLYAQTNAGYKFVGWFDGANKLSENPSFDYTMGFAKTLTAKWEYIQYSISFHYDSAIAEFDVEPPTTYTVEGLTLPQLVGKNDNGHYADGWQAENGTVYKNKIPQGTIGTLELTVIWGGTHTYGSDGLCVVCHLLRPVIGTSMNFGVYPQSEVTDNALKSMLDAEIQSKRPSAEELNGWTDYEYYIEGSVQSYMWYIDVEYNEAKYRGVYFTKLRPHCAKVSSTPENSYQDDNDYNVNTVYWFKWEPITWRILKQENGKAFLMSDRIIDNQLFYHDDAIRTINDKQIYSNNYAESDIRKWLNGTFYNTAFDEYCQKYIIQTNVDNRASTTKDSTKNWYACENTSDNVFLLSYKDSVNQNYQFDNANTSDYDRRLQHSAYAKCQGLFTSVGYGVEQYGKFGGWWLRSPVNFDFSVSYVSAGWVVFAQESHRDNSSHWICNTAWSTCGVVPAMYIAL